MYKLGVCVLMLLALPGCTAEFKWPANLPKHLDFTWTGVTVSWPVILGIVLFLWCYSWIKRKIRDAGKRKDGE